MAIAFDATSATFAGSASPFTFTTATTAGSDRVGLVGVMAVGGDTVTSVTWGGVTMTQIDKVNRGDGRYDYLYLLVAPATGAQTISIARTSGDIKGRAISYTGCAQTGQPDANNKVTFTISTSISLSFTTVADNDWLVAVGSSVTNGFTAGTNTVGRGVDDDTRFWDSNSAQTPAGSHSLNWTSIAATGDFIGVALKPVAPTGPANVKTKDGVTQSTGIKTYEGVALASVKSVEGVT